MAVISNMEYYRVFYYVARFGSVTLAAKELSISQPAVSQALKQLESQLSVKLFSRGSRGVALTEEGRVLFSYVERGYEQLELGEEQVRRLQNLEAGEIRIGASDMTLQFYLLPYLEQFHEKYPGIKVRVTNAPTPETLALLEEGKIDFGIVSEPFEQQQGMDVIPVRTIEDVFVAGRRFISYKNRMLDLQELEKLPMIFLEKNTSTRRFMDEYLAGNQVHLIPEFELATSDMIVQFACRSLGIGCVVKDFARREIESGILFELRFNKIIPRRQICVVKSTRLQLSRAAAQLMEIMNHKAPK